MDYSKLFLNKIIQEGDITQLSRHNILLEDMHTDVDKETYKFIKRYSEKNNGEVPSYASVATEVDGYEYIPDVTDSYKYLAKEIKNYSAQVDLLKWFQKKDGEYSLFERALNELGVEEFLKRWLPEQTESIVRTKMSRDRVGVSVKEDGETFKKEYKKRKDGDSIRVWKSKFTCIGEYLSSNLYTVYGKSGRGKSVITLEEGVYAATQGARVLLWALEMGMYEVLVRVYVSLSGEQGRTTALIDGVSMESGFSSADLRKGEMPKEIEESFFEFLNTLNDTLEGEIIVRAVDDDDFEDRSIAALESDIINTEADFVIIDPFYYMDYERNTSKTIGGDATNTSNKLRRLAGKTETVIIAITQADETDTEKVDDVLGRELVIPLRNSVKKTKSLLEDAYLLIAVDTDYKQGRGIVAVNKGRDGGEGNVSEILYIPNYGIVKEMPRYEFDENEFEF